MSIANYLTALDAQRDFPAIGDQYLFEHQCRYSMISRGSPNSTG